MWGAARDPHKDLGDVFRDEWMRTFVRFFRAGLIAFESYQREFRLGQARIDGADADASAA